MSTITPFRISVMSTITLLIKILTFIQDFFMFMRIIKMIKSNLCFMRIIQA
jgi:hypothetical protein